MTDNNLHIRIQYKGENRPVQYKILVQMFGFVDSIISMAKLEIKHLQGNTYYIPSSTCVGIYVLNGAAILIDSGNDKEAGRQILNLLKTHGWEVMLIINTHSNADHIGGNEFIQKRTGCRIAATRIESAFINDPILETALLFGGYPHKDLRNKFLLAKASTVTDIIPHSGGILDTGLEALPLPGHYLDMVGIRTPDNCLFIADSIFPENIIQKYHLFYLYDVGAHLATLKSLEDAAAEIYIPSHGKPVRDLQPLIKLNREKVLEISVVIFDLCKNPAMTEELLGGLCRHYEISLDANQYVLVISALKAYLSFLYQDDRLQILFEKDRMLWRQKT